MHVIWILRNYLGLTQAKLAKEVGITQPDLSEMEHLPPYGYLAKYQRLSEWLGVPVDVLVKNRLDLVPESFFDRHPAPEYLPEPRGKNHRMGRQGEELVLRREQERLRSKSAVLSRLVTPFFKMSGVTPGFDILSFDDDGVPVALEVKTVKGTTPFFRMTQNEMDRAKRLSEAGDRYVICCITGWGGKRQQMQDIWFDSMGNTHEITPMHYCCAPKTEPSVEMISGLKYFRLKCNLRQEELAQALEITQAELCGYETGNRTAPVDFYLKVSQLLGVSIEELAAEYEGVAGQRVRRS